MAHITTKNECCICSDDEDSEEWDDDTGSPMTMLNDCFLCRDCAINLLEHVLDCPYCLRERVKNVYK